MLSIYHPAPAVLRGTVTLHFDTAIAIRRLFVIFLGHVIFRGTDGTDEHQDFGRQHQRLFDCHDSGSAPLTLPPGPHTFSFDMPLATTALPSTVCSQQVDITYDLQAGLDYQHRLGTGTPTTLTTAKKQVHLVQLPSYDDFWIDSMMAVVDSQKQNTEWCQFHVLVDRRMAPIGVPLTVHVRTAPQCERLKVSKVAVELNQRCIFNNQASYRKVRLPCRAQTRHYLSAAHQGGVPWEAEMQFGWPNDGEETMTDSELLDLLINGDPDQKKAPKVPSKWLVPSFKSDNGPIQVDHALLIHVVIHFPEQRGNATKNTRRMLTFECPFDLLHTMGKDDLITGLPSYQVHADHRHRSTSLPALPLYEQVGCF
ncbi:hypothetical protein DM01DRAFT_1337780 [Hesseltinella vesiculosa]|uniref:Arrestin-like N-terminal domain-containing protein n=1 Tax=Hesseltinella vesiculosa TaxID=101127 RepID=A0A1X2GBL4_9FUNG|nr:hypothetical protein DM01DRAFT_1337780 [Hesseltinella vesiculosa]